MSGTQPSNLDIPGDDQTVADQPKPKKADINGAAMELLSALDLTDEDRLRLINMANKLFPPQ